MSKLEWHEVPEARVAEVHRDAFVFDFSPLGEPFVMTDRHRAVMERELDMNAPVPKILRSMLNDRLVELEDDPEARNKVCEIWRASGVNAVQITLGGLELDPSGWDAVVRDAAHWQRRTHGSEDMSICVTAAELEHARAADKVGIILGMQDAAPIGSDLDRLTTLRNFGVRVIQLTVNHRNLIGDGCTEREQAGLSKFGVQVVKRMNELGIIVDVSHSGYKTTLDAIELSEQPVAITHASCMAVAEHPRAKTDDQLRALRDRDGYIGILCVPFFIRPEGGADLDMFIRHVAHAADIVGVERVGIGTDWGGWSPDFPAEIQALARAKLAKLGFDKKELPEFGEIIPELDGWEAWPRITAGLMAYGFSDNEVRGLIGGNWLSFMRRSLEPAT